MKKYCLALLFLAFSGAIAWGQSGPGFLGKHWTVHYNYSFFGNYPQHFKDKATREFRTTDWLKGRHELDLDYSGSRHTSYGLGYGISNGGYGQTADLYSHNYLSQSISVYRKKFKVIESGAIAPLGKYRMIRVLMIHTRFGLDENPDIFDDPVRRQEQTQWNAGITFGWGRQVILWEQLIVNTGFEIGGVLANTADGSALETIDQWRNNQAPTPYGMILFDHVLSFRVGLSWVAF